jgi:hypothetical protein
MSELFPWKSADVCAALRLRYPTTEYAIAFEVPHEVGGGNRRADCVVMNLWRSRGLEILGFEVKVSRSDWLSELKKPEKADSLARYCDRWYLVISDPKIVKDGELPPTWGLLCRKGDRLVEVVKAPKQKPVALDRPFLASMLRANGGVAAEEVKALVNAQLKEAVDRQTGYQEQMTKRVQTELDELRSTVKEFEQHSGLTIYSKYRWNNSPEKTGAAVKFLVEGGMDKVPASLAQVESTVQTLLASIQSARAAVEITTEQTGAPSDGTN